MAESVIRSTISETQRSGMDRDPVVSIASHESFKRAPVTNEELYHSLDSLPSSQLGSALRVVAVALQHVDSAMELLGDRDRIGSDDAMHHYQVLLPELFACRSIGEGFGLVVSSLQNIVSRLRGKPMDDRQIRCNEPHCFPSKLSRYSPVELADSNPLT